MNRGRPLGWWGIMRPRVANPQASLISYLSQFKKNSSLKLFAEGYRSGMMALEKVRSMIDAAGPSSLEQVEAKFLKWLRG